ncbi:CLUMA_CG018126, isoform A [Clunio marinus]|uniref:CLUMA_CG018126, isoform A n=1 Tax=Clunio marinus TaxID=568069 RepID=A0A1J1IZC5_9DIPT|nr:CLUMA_CG018126, isoform A [Clunio marinus]
MNTGVICISLTAVIFLILPTESAEIGSNNILSRNQRSEEKLCSSVSPCQWGVYGSNERKVIQYHIKTASCVCGEDRKCSISEDSLSMKAFIYRCVQDETSSITPDELSTA